MFRKGVSGLIGGSEQNHIVSLLSPYIASFHVTGKHPELEFTPGAPMILDWKGVVGDISVTEAPLEPINPLAHELYHFEDLMTIAPFSLMLWNEFLSNYYIISRLLQKQHGSLEIPLNDKSLLPPVQFLQSNIEIVEEREKTTFFPHQLGYDFLFEGAAVLSFLSILDRATRSQLLREWFGSKILIKKNAVHLFGLEIMWTAYDELKNEARISS